MRRACPYCSQSGRVVGRGSFTTKWNHQRVPRYYCAGCGRGFSSHTGRPNYRQKKPYLNRQILELYSSTLTQRRMARLLRVNRKTIIRKFLLLSLRARRAHELSRERLECVHVQFDEMESFEHSRLKLLSIALCVDAQSRKALAIDVGRMPYKGKLARFARKKYGPRPDERPELRRRVLTELVSSPQIITTDDHPSYTALIRRLFPDARHVAVPSAQATRFRPEGSRRNIDDPMFAFNHTAAKLRQDLSRLLRKSWVTTKRPDRLKAHLDLYVAFHNGYKII